MTRRQIHLLAAALSVLAAAPADAGTEADYPRVFRTFMPDSGPSAFAVELSPSLALCYDPLRGGVSQVWKGRIDLSPTLRAKINEAAAVVGETFYLAEGTHSLRLGEPEAPPEHRFKGYRYEAGAVVFDFTLGGHPVSETLRAGEGGRGLVREFAFPADGGPAFLRLEKSATAEIRVEGGTEVQAGLWRFPEGGKATVLILPILPKAPAP